MQYFGWNNMLFTMIFLIILYFHLFSYFPSCTGFVVLAYSPLRVISVIPKSSERNKRHIIFRARFDKCNKSSKLCINLVNLCHKWEVLLLFSKIFPHICFSFTSRIFTYYTGQQNLTFSKFFWQTLIFWKLKAI